MICVKCGSGRVNVDRVTMGGSRHRVPDVVSNVRCLGCGYEETSERYADLRRRGYQVVH